LFVCHDCGPLDHLFVRSSGSKQALVCESACLSDTLWYSQEASRTRRRELQALDLGLCRRGLEQVQCASDERPHDLCRISAQGENRCQMNNSAHAHYRSVVSAVLDHVWDFDNFDLAAAGLLVKVVD
jgi:hypothetical protein